MKHLKIAFKNNGGLDFLSKEAVISSSIKQSGGKGT
jgi:hypothetical protein